MGFLKNLFKRKCIIKTEIVDAEDGLDAEEQMCNELLAYEEFGFEGFIDATIYNDCNSPKTTFLLYYDDGSTELATVNDDSKEFFRYISLLEEDEF